jgi:hypothetical protein
METINKNLTYNIICEIKPTGDLGVNIADEKLFTDGVKSFIESVLKKEGYKVFLPSDTLTKIASL